MDVTRTPYWDVPLIETNEVAGRSQNEIFRAGDQQAAGRLPDAGAYSRRDG